MTSKGEVITSAVASVDPDSAEVLVVADANVTTVFDARARHFRWEVSLVKVDGTVAGRQLHPGHLRREESR